MKISLPLVIALLLVLGGVYLCYEAFQRPEAIESPPAAPVAQNTLPAPASQTLALSEPAQATPAGATTDAVPAKTKEAELAAHREIDKAHLRAIHAGLFAYKAKHGHFPEYLSQLVPDYISADILTTPRANDPTARHFLDGDHPDPHGKPAYGFEFSNLEFRDGRTFAEIKEVQRSEWGDVVPLLRAFGYDGKVLNMAYSGDFYETQLNWEWDAATLDVVDKVGWGPGLSVGDTVRVQVLGPDGKPAPNATVWADGRNYSFDLPDRPFVTDADGYVTIPVGSDVDRTELALRAEAPGLAAQAIRLGSGDVSDQTLKMGSSVTVSGIALDANGRPIAGRRVFLQTPGSYNDNQTLAQAITDSNGRWKASLHPSQAKEFNAIVTQPGGRQMKYESGAPVDASAAAQGTAVVRERP